jgi:hypothetical protein
MSGKESGIETGLVAYLRSTRCALRGGRPATASSTFRDFTTSFRETCHVRPGEQLYFSTLPMNGCDLLHTTNMASA